MEISEDHKEWAKYLRARAGGNTSVVAYNDDDKKNKTHIFSSVKNGGVLASTIGLMDFDQSRNENLKVYSEVIMDKRGEEGHIGNVISTIAFYIMKDGWKVAPGVIFERMVEMYVPNTNLPHVMFTAPFQWEGLSKIELTNKTIYPLIAIPISEAEAVLAAIDKGQELEKLWMKNEVDVLDWSRKSAA